jgi:hypothetical protein
LEAVADSLVQIDAHALWAPAVDLIVGFNIDDVGIGRDHQPFQAPGERLFVSTHAVLPCNAKQT